MVKGSKIEWTDHTFNPWIGCQRVGRECDNCYAEAQNQRWRGGMNWGPMAPRTRTASAYWLAPLRWNAEADSLAAEHGRRQRVFCASLADVFDNAAPIDARNDLWALIQSTPNLDWMLLTKRPQNMARFLPDDWGDGWDNVALGVTAGTMEAANRDIPILQATPARRRFISCEPMLERLDICTQLGIWWNQTTGKWVRERDSGIHLIIAGGESGTGARPMHPSWPKSLRDQAAGAGVPFMFKQWGAWKPVSDMTDAEADAIYHPAPADRPLDARRTRFQTAVMTPSGKVLPLADPDAYRAEGSMMMIRLGKARAGRNLDGRTHNGSMQRQS